ncbi:MAG: tRNA (guanosine(37)-N1)-methyltransferase TrmD, partial [Anaerolineaceae bacterium]
HYTRPPEYQEMRVPEVLLSGNHAEIERWRREQSLKRTFQRRPDLLKKTKLSKKDIEYLDKLKQEKQRESS